MAEEVFPYHRDYARKAILEPQDQEAQIEAVAQQIANAEARGENRQHGRFRVLRVLEYVYPDAETAFADMANWQVQTMRRMGGTTIRSTTLPPEVLP
jgi:hypothetical protein